jgi:hypothetical protein
MRFTGYWLFTGWIEYVASDHGVADSSLLGVPEPIDGRFKLFANPSTTELLANYQSRLSGGVRMHQDSILRV